MILICSVIGELWLVSLAAGPVAGHMAEDPIADQGAEDPTLGGLWLDASEQAAIRIEACGDELCGRVVWLAEPLGPHGEPKLDLENRIDLRGDVLELRGYVGIPLFGRTSRWSRPPADHPAHAAPVERRS